MTRTTGEDFNKLMGLALACLTVFVVSVTYSLSLLAGPVPLRSNRTKFITRMMCDCAICRRAHAFVRGACVDDEAVAAAYQNQRCRS